MKHISLALMTALSLSAAVRASNLTLWYNAPGTVNVTQGLLLGNGRLGAIVPGNVTNENIVLNESSLWAGNANLSGGYDTGPTAAFGAYQVFGNLRLNLPGQANYTGYKRALDIGTGVATVDYTNNGVAFHRELFCSAPDQVMVVQLTADAGASYSGSIQLTDSHSNTVASVAGGLMFSGVLANGELYEAQLQVTNSGGTLVNNGGVLNFTNCDSLTLVVALGTDYVTDYGRNYHGNNPHTNVVAQATAAVAKSFTALEWAHMNDFSALFNRVSIWLGNAPAARTNLPTDQRIIANAASDDDPWMEQLMFQYGRYLMISSSRTGLPMNLQGLWNDSNNPPWASDYHTDINVQMMYWEAEVANLSECFQPFINFIQSQIPAWRYVTTNTSAGVNNGGYGGGFGGTNGWTLRTSHNINGGEGWNWIQSGNAWYCMHLWEHYAFTGDTNYLFNTAYPILKETCQFWQQHLKPIGANTNGLPGTTLIATKGWSPEHGPWENGVSFDQELIWDLFNNYIQACKILGVDSNYCATVSSLQTNLLVPGIGPWGELREWLYTADSPTDDHRHTMHLVGLYPGRQFTPAKTPALAAAARVGLLAHGDTGDSGYEWAHAWRISLFARLHDWWSAHHKLQLYCGTLEPNLVAYYSGSTAQWDGSCGVTAGITEMLLQSHENQIHLLPALPNAWPVGSVSGLVARGGYTVGIAWTNAAATATITPGRSGNCVVHAPNPVTVTLVGLPVTVTTNADCTVQWPAAAGNTYTLQWVQPPFLAQMPSPADYAAGVNIGTGLSWLAGGTNYQHDVYWGTSSNAVATATTNSPQYLGRTGGTNVSPPLLLPRTTYFWRVDEISGTNIGAGTVWQFTTAASFAATNPSPAVARSSVLTNTALSWTPGAAWGLLNDVYIGTPQNFFAFTRNSNPPLLYCPCHSICRLFQGRRLCNR
jgi:alpha-L-fucosidase 2